MHRLICDPRNDPNKDITPTLPLVIVFADGMIIEADDIESLLIVMVGEEYLKVDNEQKCLMRIKLARNYAMLVLQYNSEAVVTLGGKVIRNNYAVSENDEDYVYTKEEIENADKIAVDSDRSLIESLVKIEMIQVLEKVGSSIFLKPSKKVSDDNSYTDIKTVLKSTTN